MELGLGQDDEDDGGDGGGGGGDCHSDGCVMMVMRVSLVQWIWVTGQQWVVLSECGGSYKHQSLFFNTYTNQTNTKSKFLFPDLMVRLYALCNHYTDTRLACLV